MLASRCRFHGIGRLANISLQTAGLPSINFWSKNSEQEEVSAREAQLSLLQALSLAGIDPHLFDLMLSNELDRSLKKQFGVAFLAATIFFTLLSYGVIIFNSIEKWGISDIAITALIVETPIQFIGLLYIIARNLFPQSAHSNRERMATVTQAKAEGTKHTGPSAPRSRRQRAPE
jgi:hypothetical protein